MDKIYKKAAILSIAVILIFSANVILAQTQASNDNISGNATSTESSEIPEEIQTIINEDENIAADDLEIKEPALLPGNPFYFVKSIGRGLKSAIIFNPVKKAELKLRFANERLIEIKKVTESNNNPKLLEKALDKYEKELNKIEKLTEKIKEKGSERTEKFIDKFIDNQIKHQKLLNKIENKVPKEIFEKIQENRQAAIQTLSDVSLTLINADRFQEKIEERMENQGGSDFKNFKNLEILKDLEDKVPETAKNAIKRAQENTLIRLNEDIKTNGEMAKNIGLYVKHINGDMEKHLEIIDELEIINELNGQDVSEKIKHTLEKAREINIERIKNEIEQVKTTRQTEEKISDTDNNPDKAVEKRMTFQESSKEQIEKSAAMIEKAKNNFETAKNNPAVNDKLNSASVLIKNAQIHLEKARTAYGQERFGEAFGQAYTATHNADNALRIIARLEKMNENSDNNDSDNNETDDEDADEDGNETDDEDATENNNSTTIINKERLCAQVITPAKNQKTGECREFPTACLSIGWYKVGACKKNQIDSIDKNSNTDTSYISTE